MTQFGYQPSLHSDFFPPAPRYVVRPPPVLPESVPVAPHLASSRSRCERIVKAACLMYGITRAELRGPSRVTLLVDARQWVAVRMTKELGLSRVQIGRWLGDRDHSTVHNLLRRAGVL